MAEYAAEVHDFYPSSRLHHDIVQAWARRADLNFSTDRDRVFCMDPTHESWSIDGDPPITSLVEWMWDHWSCRAALLKKLRDDLHIRPAPESTIADFEMADGRVERYSTLKLCRQHTAVFVCNECFPIELDVAVDDEQAR